MLSKRRRPVVGVCSAAALAVSLVLVLFNFNFQGQQGSCGRAAIPHGRGLSSTIVAEPPGEAPAAAAAAAAAGTVPAAAVPAQSGGTVTRIIHQSWKTAQLPERFQGMAATLKGCTPSFEYRLWTDEQNEALMMEHYSFFQHTWRRFPRPVFRVDSARAFYLHRYGGLYFDLDFFCLHPLEPAVANMSGVVLGYMSDDVDFAHAVPNAFMASEPGQPFWLFYLSLILERAHTVATQDNRPEHVTGPVALYDAVRQWKRLCRQRGVHHNITIMPRTAWYINDWSQADWWNTTRAPNKYCTPNSFDLAQCAAAFPASYTVTLWTHSWEAPPWVKAEPAAEQQQQGEEGEIGRQERGEVEEMNGLQQARRRQRRRQWRRRWRRR